MTVDEDEMENIIYNTLGNVVTRITSFPDFTYLDKLSWTNGWLTEFPNLHNVSDTLIELYLDKNKITTIPKSLLEMLNKVTKMSIKNNLLAAFPATTATMVLVELSLNKNLFASLPDFGTIATVLIKLSMGFNPVSEFNSNLPLFPMMVNLDLVGCQLTEPPPCHLITNMGNIGLKLKGNPLVRLNSHNDLSCVDFTEGFESAQFASVPNLCHMSTIPTLVSWASSPNYSFVDCDCSALWHKVT